MKSTTTTKQNQNQNLQNKNQYCCIIRMTLKKNNVFVNLTKTNGQTILKFTAGLIQKKKKIKNNYVH